MSFGTHAERGDVAKRQAQYNAALQGGIKGASIGLAGSLPAAYALNRTWPAFRGLTLPLKTMFVTMATVASGVIVADKSGIKFDEDHYSDQGANIQRQYRSRQEKEWAELSTSDKVLTWTKDNKFAVVAGSWVASMGGIFAYIHNQPVAFSQKLVQTRVWAQGITLGSLLAMAAITQIPSEGDKILEQQANANAHSWRDFVDNDDNDSGAPQQRESRPKKKQPQHDSETKKQD